MCHEAVAHKMSCGWSFGQATLHTTFAVAANAPKGFRATFVYRLQKSWRSTCWSEFDVLTPFAWREQAECPAPSA